MMPVQNRTAGLFSHRRQLRRYSFLLWVHRIRSKRIRPYLRPRWVIQRVQRAPLPQKILVLYNNLLQQNMLRPSRKETKSAGRKKQCATKDIAKSTKTKSAAQASLLPGPQRGNSRGRPDLQSNPQRRDSGAQTGLSCGQQR